MSNRKCIVRAVEGVVGASDRIRKPHAMGAMALIVGLMWIGPTVPAWAADRTWTGATNLNWNTTSGNWSAAPFTWNNAAIDTAIFAGAAPGTINVATPINLWAIGFTANGYTIAGTNALTFTAGGSGSYASGELRTASGITATINAPLAGTIPLSKTGLGTLILTGDSTLSGGFTISSGTLRLGNGTSTGSIAGAITNNAALIFDRSASFIQSASIGGSGSVTQSGSGILNLTGNHSFTGDFIVNTSARIGGGGASGDGVIQGNIIVNTGATLAFAQRNIVKNTSLLTANGTVDLENRDEVLGGIEGSGTILNTTNFSVIPQTALSFAGSITGSGQFRVLTGAGSQTITGSVNFASARIDSGSTLSIGNGGSTGALNTPSGVTNNGTLAFNRSDSFTRSGDISGAISGSGAVTKLGAGTMTLTGDNTYTGTSTVSAGVLQIGGSSSVDGNIRGNVVVNPGATLRHLQSDIVANTSAFTVNGTMQTNGFSEALATVAGSGSIVTSTATDELTLDLGGSAEFSGVVSGPGRLTLRGANGAGTQILSAENTHTGTTTINAGTLQIGNGGTGGFLAGDGPIAIGANGTLRFNRQGGRWVLNQISGSGNLVNDGPFDMVLLANNPGFTGTTTVNAGRLQLGDRGQSGFLQGPIVNNSEVAFSRSDDVVFSHLISGPGLLRKRATINATLTLTADNTNTGMTSVEQGTLRLGNNGTTGTVGGNIDVFEDAFLTFDRSNTVTFPHVISGEGELIKERNNTLILTANNTITGLTRIKAGTLQLGNGGTTGSVAGPIDNDGTLRFNRSDDFVFDQSVTGTGNIVKDGTGTMSLPLVTFNVSTATTINSGAIEFIDAPNAEASSIATYQINPNAALRVNRSSYFTLRGTLSGSGNLVKNGGNTLEIQQDNPFNGTTTINAGTLRLGRGGINANSGSVSGPIVNNGLLQIDRLGNLTLDDPISGSGNVSLNNNATVRLTAINTYTGTTTVNTGTLILTNANSTTAVVINGGTLQIGEGAAGGSVAASTINVNGSGTLRLNRSDDFTFTTNITGTGNLRKSGVNTVILPGPVNYSGTTTIDAGRLELGNGGVGGGVIGPVVNNGVLRVNYTTDLTIGSLSGGGSFVKDNINTVTVSGPSFTSSTLINTGTVELRAGLGGSITNNALLRLNPTADASFAPISGPGNLTKIGNAVATLNISSNYTGSTTVDGGTLVIPGASTSSSHVVSSGVLQIGTGGTTGSISGLITNNGAVRFNRSDSFALSNPIVGTGSLIKAGAGTLKIDSATTYGGNTAVEDGTLQIGDGGTIGSINANLIFVGSVATLRLNRSDDLVLSNIIYGDGEFTKNGTNNVVLAGITTHSGTTTIDGGTLEVQRLNGGAVVNNGLLLRLAGPDDFSIGSISGSGSVAKDGAGTVTLIGNNTLAGTIAINAGTLAFDRGITHATLTTGIGGVVKTDSGTVNFTADNTYTGLTTINGGAIQLGSGGTTGNIVGPITINSPGALSFNRSDDFVLTQSITGNGAILKNGPNTVTVPANGAWSSVSINAGRLVLTADATPTITTINAGTLQLGNNGTVGSVTGNIVMADSTTIIVNRSDNTTFDLSKLIPQSTQPGLNRATFVKDGAGTLTAGLFSGNVNLNRSFVVRGGTLILSDAFLGENIDVRIGGTLVFDYTGSTSPLEVLPFLTNLGTSDASPTIALGSFDDVAQSRFILRATLIGDTNLDGAVNFTDLLTLARNYNQDTPGNIPLWSAADFDLDAFVGFGDLLALARNYNQSLSMAESAALGQYVAADWALARSMVPEPGAITMLAAAGVTCLRRRRV